LIGINPQNALGSELAPAQRELGRQTSAPLLCQQALEMLILLSRRRIGKIAYHHYEVRPWRKLLGQRLV
jgi:hypothetical protein